MIMILVPPFSLLFWFSYSLGGISDILDGWIARRLNQTSMTGAWLDSIADLSFAVSITVTVLRNIRLPLWLWFCILIILSLRLVSYGIGLYKYHCFSSLHTNLNKAAGILLFAFPLLYTLTGLTVSAVFVCSVSFLSAVEELIITRISKTLDRNRRGLF